MNIYPLNNNSYKYNNKYVQNANFGTKSFITTKSVQKIQNINWHPRIDFEYIYRILNNKKRELCASKTTKAIMSKISGLKPESSPKYLEELINIGRICSTKKRIAINIEDKILETLAASNDSTIFIMNHSNQDEDPQMLEMFITLLSDCYKNIRKENFPLPKIILNEDILKSASSLQRKAFENIGAIGIDASVSGGNKTVNTKALFPVLKDFAKDKCNIFIFPEGRLAINKNLDFYDRCQIGISSIINKMLNIKKSVKVVPVGFAYGKGTQKDMASIQIGTPLELKRNLGVTTITSGDILKSKQSILYNFFNKNKDSKDIVITQNERPVPTTEITDYIHSIICENLEINTNIAKEQINISYNSDAILY